MKWCLWCGERLRRNAFRSYNGWVHQDGSVYKTYVGTDGVERDDHCVLPTNDQKAAERMAAEGEGGMMGCRWCNHTGWMREHEEESGWVDIRCPYCVGVDGEEPDIVTEGHDAATQAEIDEAWVAAVEELEGGP